VVLLLKKLINLERRKEVRVGKLKSLMMRTEEMLADCLNDKGMTNEQALDFIKSKLGVMCHDHAKDTLKKWNNN
jgi:hypothetical protein